MLGRQRYAHKCGAQQRLLDAARLHRRHDPRPPHPCHFAPLQLRAFSSSYRQHSPASSSSRTAPSCRRHVRWAPSARRGAGHPAHRRPASRCLSASCAWQAAFLIPKLLRSGVVTAQRFNIISCFVQAMAGSAPAGHMSCWSTGQRVAARCGRELMPGWKPATWVSPCRAALVKANAVSDVPTWADGRVNRNDVWAACRVS
jgi:hypothetical protein